MLNRRSIGGSLLSLAALAGSFAVTNLSTSVTQVDHTYGYAALAFAALAIIAGALAWFVFPSDPAGDTSKDIRAHHGAVTDSQIRADRKSTVNTGTLADRGGIAAGRDVVIHPPTAGTKPERPIPSFDLRHSPSPDGWVHLALVNFAEVGTFHVDVTRIEKATTEEKTPYGVTWRGSPGEDRQVVNECLIDLAEIEEPWYEDPNSDVVLVSARRKVGNWYVGRFHLYSHSSDYGWAVEADSVKGPDGMPARIALFLEEIAIHVVATRLDTKERVERTVTIGFNRPTWNEGTGRWVTQKGIRVQVV
jgi:hypothetical protein